VLESGPAAERIRWAVVDARIGDEKVARAVLCDSVRHLAQRITGDPVTLPGGLDAPARLPRGNAVVLDLPIADAPHRNAVGVDPEHVGLTGRIQAQVAGVALDQLIGRLGAAEVTRPLRRVRTFEHTEIRSIPSLEGDLHRAAVLSMAQMLTAIASEPSSPGNSPVPTSVNPTRAHSALEAALSASA